MKVILALHTSHVRSGLVTLISALWSAMKWPAKMPVPAEENVFLKQFARQYLLHRRAAVLFSVVLWGLFSGLDLYFYREHEPGFGRTVVATVLTLRGMGFLYGLVVLRISFGSAFLDERRADRWLMGSAILTGALIETMLFFTPVKLDYDYYFGLALLLSFVYSVLHLPARCASLTAFVIFLGLLLEELSRRAACPDLPAGLCFFAAFCVTGNAVAVRIEASARERFRTVSELSAVSSDLAEAQRLLNDMMEQRERALRTIFHDLQQPLTAIGTHALVARRRVQGEQHASDIFASFEVIECAAGEIQGLLEEMRDCSALEVRQPSLQAVPLASLLQDIVTLFGPQARQKGLELHLRLGRAAPTALTDPGWLRRVLENLLSNAIKYTDRGHVLIGCVLLPGLIRIDVRDTGRGIPLDAQDRIFDEFYQAPGSDAPTGSGLGLAIVRSLIDRLPDHRVTLASRPGWGSRFSIYLPTGTE